MSVGAALLAWALLLVPAQAAQVTIDLNGVATPSGYATGSAVASYLAGFGVTTPNTLTVLDTLTYANYIASPTKNVLTGGDGRNPTVLTLQFNQAVANFSFTRAGINGANSPSGTIAGDWTATAYNAADVSLGSVGEALTSFYGSRSARVFTINASDIRKVIFQGYDRGYAGINTPHVTLLQFTTGVTPTSYPLTVSLSGSGSVQSSPAGITCQPICSADFNPSTAVTLSQSPASGQRFTGWSGSCTGAGTCSVTMNAAAAVTATFQAKFTSNTALASSANPSSAGQSVTFTATIAASGATPTGTVTFKDGSAPLCDLVAIASSEARCIASALSTGAHSIVAEYSGDGSVAASSATLTQTVQAASSYALSVTRVGAGSGTVTSSPSGINCGSTCSAQFATGSSVVLTAAPASGSIFGGWSGGCSGTGTCTVAVSATTTVTATFSVAPPALTLTPSSLDFGAQSMMTTTAPRTITVSNTGSTPVSAISVTAPSEFNASHDCSSLSAGGTCTVRVTFTPTGQVSFAGSLQVASAAGTFTAALSGKGERSLVGHYYNAILRRTADAPGKDYWEGESIRLQGLGSDVNETWYAMTASFLSSPEYRAFNRDDNGFVTDLYTTFFNRPPDAPGLAYWTGQIAQGLPREVALVFFMFSPEFKVFTSAIFGNAGARSEVDTVVDLYRGLLSRLPDSDGFRYWVRQFRQAQCVGPSAVYAQVESISSSYMNGPEYTGRNRSNAQFVGDLYNAFLRRGGDLEGVRYWIGQLDSRARTRDEVRRAFISTPEFGARVNAIISNGCLPSGTSMTEGSFTFSGTLPPLGDVTFTTRSGTQIVAKDSYLGWVEMIVKPDTVGVAEYARTNGGRIVAQSPNIGIYVIDVGAGNERAFLNGTYSLSFLIEAGPVTPAVRGTNWTLDWNFGAPTSPCLNNHGTLVTDIANRHGGAFALELVSAHAFVTQSLADVMARKLENVPSGQHQVINMSIGIACVTGPCFATEIQFKEYLFLVRFFAAMERLNEQRPDLANRNLVTIIAGNTGVTLDAQLAALKQNFPNAFKRIVIVGGVDAAGSSTSRTNFNYLTDDSTRNMVYARGINATARLADGTTLTCTGTSFAGPEVASVLEAVWQRNPNLTSEQIVNALRQALIALGTSYLPQDASGRTTTAFIDSIVNIAAPPTYTLSIAKAGSGAGNVTPNPPGLSYVLGTRVTLSAAAAAGSSFAGWSGAGCSGTGTCVVTMNSNQSVTATFNATCGANTIRISGRITNRATGAAISGAQLLVVNDTSSVTATSSSDGSYAICVPTALSAQTSSVVLQVSQSDYIDQGVAVNLTLGAQVVSVALELRGNDTVIVETALHHLGDGNYSGGLNVGFQRLTAEGLGFSKFFNLGTDQAPQLYTSAILEITSTGAECADPISINGQLIGTLNNTAGGPQNLTIPFSVSVLRFGSNTFSVQSTNVSCDGYDDFEFSNARIRLRR